MFFITSPRKRWDEKSSCLRQRQSVMVKSEMANDDLCVLGTPSYPGPWCDRFCDLNGTGGKIRIASLMQASV